MKRPKVLVLSRTYPNSVFPSQGLWVKHLLVELSRNSDIKVIAPTPYSPPSKIFKKYAKYRRIEKHNIVDGMEIFYPRLIVGPGYSLRNFEGLMYFLSAFLVTKRLWKTFKFDIIHANFVYPDGFAASLLGKIYNKPVIITEHAHWGHWWEEYPFVGKQALWAAKNCFGIAAVSNDLKKDILNYYKKEKKIKVIPCGVDGSLFERKTNDINNKPKRILLIGWIIYRKGIDILLKAIKLLKEENIDVQATIIGQSYFDAQKKEENELLQMAQDMGLNDVVNFAGGKSQKEIAVYMNQSDIYVLASRRETFGAVLVEAMACGLPVVATRCGGPEDIVTPEVGVLVPKEDERALAEGIKYVIENYEQYDGGAIRRHAIEKFSWYGVARKFEEFYNEALG